MPKADLKVGDSVVVKPGVQDVDLGGDIGGWQGRVVNVYPAEHTVGIRWDSITLKNMPPDMIEHCEEEGLDWSEMGLDIDEVTRARPRDTERDVAAAKKEISARYGWFALGSEQGRGIQAVVNSAKGRDEQSIFQAWHSHLEAHLKFPFAAHVSESGRGPVRYGDRVSVLATSMLDDLYGTIVAVKHRQGIYELPLCDLEADETESEEVQQLVDDYATWFANR